jgi:hypothetical protein
MTHAADFSTVDTHPGQLDREKATTEPVAGLEERNLASLLAKAPSREQTRHAAACNDTIVMIAICVSRSVPETNSGTCSHTPTKKLEHITAISARELRREHANHLSGILQKLGGARCHQGIKESSLHSLSGQTFHGTNEQGRSISNQWNECNYPKRKAT